MYDEEDEEEGDVDLGTLMQMQNQLKSSENQQNPSNTKIVIGLGGGIQINNSVVSIPQEKIENVQEQQFFEENSNDFFQGFSQEAQENSLIGQIQQQSPKNMEITPIKISLKPHQVINDDLNLNQPFFKEEAEDSNQSELNYQIQSQTEQLFPQQPLYQAPQVQESSMIQIPQVAIKTQEQSSSLIKLSLNQPPVPQPQVISFPQQPPQMIQIPQQIAISNQGSSTILQIPLVKDEPIIIPLNQMPPQPKEKKKRKKKGKGSLMEFYDLKKVKYTMEIDHESKRLRAQTIYKLDIKDKETVEAKLLKLKEDKKYKKYLLELYLQAKSIQILSASLLQNKKEKQEIAFDYPQPVDQATFQNIAFMNISKDLHTLETKQKQVYDNEQINPVLYVKNIVKLNFKKDDVISQFQPRLYLLIEYYLEKITDMIGICAVDYNSSISQGLNFSAKQNAQVDNGKLQINANEQVDTYYYTSDLYDQNQTWMPLIKGTQFQAINWTLNFVVPKNFSVVASGTLVNRQIESDGLQRGLFTYKLKDNEVSIPEKIGFIIGKFPFNTKLSDLSQACSQGAYAFFISAKKYEVFNQNRFYEKNIYNILSYLQKLIQFKYPYNSLKIVFVPNLILRSSRKQSFDYAGGLHILDEEILFQRNQLENRYNTYKYLASSLSYDFFGGKVYEETPDDAWLLIGLRESLGNHYKIAKCGVLLYRYHIMKTIEDLYKKMKLGIERYSLQSTSQPHPAERLLNEIVYQKCELIMHMIESMIDKSYYERIIRQLYESASPTISTGLFLKIFKQVCGFKLKQFCTNWILSTSCPQLTASFVYNKKNNSLDLNITQKSAMKDYFAFKRFLRTNIDASTLFQTPFTSKDIKQSIRTASNNIDSFYVELNRDCLRWFQGEVNVMIYLTDGAEIQTQQQKMSLKFGKSSVSVNIPLHYKVKKTIQNKKKEYENMLMYDQEMHQDDEDQNMEGNGMNNNQSESHHLIDNSSWKFGLNDFELEDYPYGTKNLFDVKNLESPVLWIRVDPDMEYIRKVKVQQEQNNWLFQLLQEKDIIGQIEALQQLYKFNTELVYEILKSVSTNENYFFKVRKVALRSLQKMQVSQFNKYLSHEKFLIKIFNQRNFDKSIGFYKSNDFTKVLEYYIDKYILKILSKCKEQELTIKEEIKEQQLNFLKQQSTIQDNQPSVGNISINLLNNEIISTSVRKEVQLKPNQIYISSDQLAQLLIKLLQENDNSENPFDDSFYLKQILRALGDLDCFKFMPEIAQEIYRQFRLDYIAKFSPQFALTKGSIAAYYNLRKRIFLFLRDKIGNIDEIQEDIGWYRRQIQRTEEEVLDNMGRDLQEISYDHKWPLEIRDFIYSYEIKHAFLYKNNSFLKALFLQLKKVDELQTAQQFRDAVHYLEQLVYFLERNKFKVDYREIYLNNEKSRAIVQIIWQLICLPMNYLFSSLSYWMKRLYYLFFSNEVPQYLKEDQYQMGIKMEEMKYDDYWTQIEEQFQEQNVLMGQQTDDRDKHLKQILASRSAQVIVRTPKGDKGYSDFTKSDQDNKLKIVLGQSAANDTFTNLNKQQWLQQQAQEKSIKISLGGLQLDSFIMKQQSDFDSSTRYNEQDQKMQLMQSLSNQQNNYYGGDNQQNDQQMNDDESIYDEFAEIKFDIDWQQRAWEVLGLLWYHEESQAFLEPVTERDLGNYFQQYLRVIDYPMDFTTMKENMKAGQYSNLGQFKRDVLTIFKNCQIFNDESSEIHKASVKLQRFFWQKMGEYGLLDDRSTIRIN